MPVITADLLILILGLCFYAALPKFGKIIFTVVVYLLALSLYGCLFWIWLVFLDGMSWVQWFFGFAIIASLMPAVACTVFIYHTLNPLLQEKK